jgi:AraC-like DNA-binding protein
MLEATKIETVSNTAAKDLLETCHSLGVLSAEDLLAIGIEQTTLNDPTLRFPEDKLIAIWQRIAENSKYPDIGLLIGQTINPAAKGLLSSWVSQAESIGEALEIFRKHIALMNPSEYWAFDDDNEHCTLRFLLNKNKAYPTIASERSMSALVSWGRVLSGHEFPLIEANFVFPCPDHHALFSPIFGDSISFDMPENSLKFDSRMLKLPIANGNQYLKTLIGDKAKDLLQTLTQDYSFTSKTKHTIENMLLTKGAISIDAVCEKLAVSRQTLYRKLKEEGSDYKSLSEEYKKTEALRLLQFESANITNISLRLGFKDSSSFYKAFKRWFGMSPKAYIQSIGR